MSAPQRLLAHSLRVLAMDAVQAANSGHPGMPMGMAEIAVALWTGPLRHNPANPRWANRDRFILSNGHGSMLQYALLHLTGYDLPIDELKRFRQLGSRTPGHPEVGVTPGVETTSGPLGQGLGNAVGMALAEKLLAAHFNRDGLPVVDHRTWVFAGDGCLMEGLSHEVCSLAGTWGLSKLVVFYDDNGISIDGEVRDWFTDDTPRRFEAYGWNVIRGVDGHDLAAVNAAIEAATAERERPTLVCCRTVIGHGAPTKAGSADAHGAPLGEAEIAATRAGIGWGHGPFEVPAEIYAGWDARDRGAAFEREWDALFDRYRRAHPDLATEFERRIAGELPSGWGETVSKLVAHSVAKAETVATRKASQLALDVLAPALPELLGGTADLAASVLNFWKGHRELDPKRAEGNYIHYGVREFGMAAIMNGVALHGGFIPQGGTFLVFSDYARNAVRMSALMHQRVVYVFTHDSIGLGEDGPTHQPVEHIASLRLLPGMHVWRPCDTVETAIAWARALERRNGPSALILSRQNVAFQKREPAAVDAISRGGYVLADAEGGPARAVIIATGSEVPVAMAARALLAGEGVGVRVVSMPCVEVFDAQDAAWRESVLPNGVPRVAVEAGVPHGWWKYVGLGGAVVGLDRFGESAPGGALFKHFGFTGEAVAAAVRRVI